MIHVVAAGETLSGIAESYGISPTLLAYENALSSPDRLVVGQALLVLIPQLTHTVVENDTLYTIAQTYGVSQNHLYRLNPWLEGRPELWPGQSVIISYTEQPEGEMIINGYTYVYVDLPLLRQVLPYLSAIQPFTYGFTNNGDLVMLDDQEILTMASSKQTDAMMVVSPLDAEGHFNNELISSVLYNEAAREKLLGSIVQTVLQKGYAGCDLDFEYVREKDSAAYVGFVAELALLLHREERIISVALAPKYYAEQQGLLYEGHDYEALGAAADLTMLMTYEWGYTYGPPLAVAPLYEVRRVVEYGLSEIPAEKILLGVPNYGYDWTLPYKQGRPARSISNVRAVELAWLYGAEIKFDDSAQSPYFEYVTAEGVQHIVWFEDIRSLNARIDLVREYGLSGITFWTVTRPFPAGFLQLAVRENPAALPPAP